MYFSAIKKIAIILFLIGLPFSALAVGLGSVNVTSSLGEPLQASVELLSVTSTELATLKTKLDTKAAYAEQGLTRLPLHDEVKLRINTDAGRNTLVLTSASPVLEPFLDLLVVAEWSNGRVTRQYTLLLDPPIDESSPSQIQAPTTKRVDKDTVEMPALNDSAEEPTFAPAIQEHLTKRGDTLYKVARSMQQPGVSLAQVLVALFEANPDAFDGKNMNRLKVGKILQAPSQEALSTITSQYAHQEIKLQTTDWNNYRNKLAEVVLQKAPEVNAETGPSTSGKIKSATEELSDVKSATKDVVKLSTADINQLEANANAKITALQEEITAREKGLKEAEERTAALEKQIEDMQKLLALKNNAMLNAQEQATEQAGDNQPTVDTSEKSAPVMAPSAKLSNEKQPNFFSNMLESGLDKLTNFNQALIAALLALVVLLVALWLYFRNKRSKKLDDFEQGIMTSGSLKASTIIGDTATGTLTTGDTSFLTDFSHSASNGLIDTNDVDPIAEAEVYMAYGRDAQAEEILKDAISKEPQRYALHLKLLEMYAANKNTISFETIASELYASLGGDNPIWSKVIEMGAKLEPNNPLYQKTNDTVDEISEADFPVSNSVKTNTDTSDFIEKAPQIDLPSEDPLDISDFSDSPLAAEVDLDFSVSDNVSTDNPAVAGVDSDITELASRQNKDLENFDEQEQALSFDLNASDAGDQEIKKVISSIPSLDFPTIETESTRNQDIETMSLKDAGQKDRDIATGASFNEADLGADAKTLQLQEDNDNSEVGFDLGVDKDNQNEVNTAHTNNVLDVSDISLDMDDELSFVDNVSQQVEEEMIDEDVMTPAQEEVETKLELVAAYIDMEDKDGARELLEEVLKEGSISQRKRADQMLASLA